jgi:hypothetical protein
MLRFWALALTFAFFTMMAACGDEDSTDVPSPTSAPTRGRTPVETRPPIETPAIDIREIDLETLPEVQAVLNPPPPDPGFPEEQPGVFSQADVIYADVTNDGHDDAIVPIFADSAQGMGFFLVSLNGTEPQVLLEEFPDDAPGLRVLVEGEKIVLLQPVPGVDDPECCPSMIRRTVYAWNGSAIAVETVTTEPNPDLAGSSTPQS